MVSTEKPVMTYNIKKKLLYICADKKISTMIDIIILNDKTETVMKMKIISGSHRIDLSSLNEKEYAVKLVAGNNVWVQKITNED